MHVVLLVVNCMHALRVTLVIMRFSPICTHYKRLREKLKISINHQENDFACFHLFHDILRTTSCWGAKMKNAGRAQNPFFLHYSFFGGSVTFFPDISLAKANR